MPVFFACIGPVDEGGNARGRYDRMQFEHTLSGTVVFRWNLGSEGGILNTAQGYGWHIYQPVELGLTSYPDVRLWIDEKSVGDWISGPPHYLFSVNVDALISGHHVMRVEGRGGGQPYFCSNVLFHTGPPIPLDQPQRIWSAPCKFDYAYRELSSDRAVSVTYPGFVPTPNCKLIPARITEPWTDLSTKLWVTRMGISIPGGLGRAFTIRNNHVGCANYQQYHYFDSRYDRVSLRDGLRGTSTLGHCVAGRVAPNGSLYWLSTNPRLGWTSLSGKTLTVAFRHLKSGINGSALNPTPALQPYIGDSVARNERLETFVNWRTPVSSPTLFEPWDLAFWSGGQVLPGHPLVLITDTQPMTTYGSKTGISRVVAVDHTPVHTGGLPHAWEIWRHPTPGAEIWGIDRNPLTGRYHVSGCMSHDEWALEISVTGEPGNLDVQLKSAERVWISAKQPLLKDIGLYERFMQYAGNPATLRSSWNVDGPLGTASAIFPQALRFMSDGSRLIASRYTFSIHRRYPDNHTEVFAAHPNPIGGRDWVLDVNTDGSTGPKDLVRGNVWYSASDAQWTEDGIYRGRALPEARTSADMLVIEGPSEYFRGVPYPWMMASGNGAVWFAATGSNGFWRMTKRQQTDPILNAVLYAKGRNLYKNASPSFTLSHGNEFQNLLGTSVPDELAEMSDSDLGTFWRAGLGTGIPRVFSDADIAALIYYTRWNAVTSTVSPPSVTPRRVARDLTILTS